MSRISHQAQAELARVDAHIFQSELIVTRQQARVDSLERAGNDGSLSRLLLKNFKTVLEIQYAYRNRALRQLRR
jgi:hypothetical protein